MSWKRRLLAGSLRYTALLSLIRSLKRCESRRLTVLAYHRIGEPVDPENYPFDHDFISATPDGFEWQMNYIKKHFDPVSFADVEAFIAGEAKWPERPIVVTFDDGFDDNYHIAYPILKKLCVPATMFVCTDYIGSSETFWFDRVIYLFKKTTATHYDLGQNEGPSPIAVTAIGKYEQARKLVKYFRTVKNDIRLRFLKKLEEQLGDKIPDSDCLSQTMNWDMVVELAASGIEIGSHSCSHPNLTQLDSATLLLELTKSRAAIAEKIGVPPQVIAYPAGDAKNFNEEVVAATKRAGYSIAASYVSGVNPIQTLNQHSLLRLHVESYTTQNEFAAMLELPRVFG